MASPAEQLTDLHRLSSSVRDWVDEARQLTTPDEVYWCDGSDAEYRKLIATLEARKELSALNAETFPGCHLYRSDPSDVARVEHLTYVCTRDREDAGSNNYWMNPGEAHKRMDDLFRGCMKGRTLYVVPYCMGPIDSPYARVGVEITDSAYVVVNMRLMTRMGRPALERIAREGRFVKGLHSVGDLNPDRRFIMHFPEELSILSFGSGYGGNALLGKKCHALRIASWQARDEGWLAEHMMIVGVENPQGAVHYIAAAFPSACGKTNLAMLVPPESYRGWKIWTVGDDIAWLHVGADGRLWAINPESGYFGVVPGTNRTTNRNAFDMIRRDTLFTNVAVTANNEPWWEGLDSGKPVTDWLGKPYDPTNGPAAHPNSRFTVAAHQNPWYSTHADDAAGVPISAIVFGGRRRELTPLVMQARNWAHGVLVGAAMGSETTAAAVGDVGVVRRDPMAMKPFCGYNFGDYWSHWLSFDQRASRLPKVFHVNWFRRDRNGKFLWPGFGDNLRVLRWMIDRCTGQAGARETPIGWLPNAADLDLTGTNVKPEALSELLKVDPALWRAELEDIGSYLETFGERLPKRLLAEHRAQLDRLGS
jgi:phosphoenolpyruvate carboxykinase (GTP)